MRIRTPLIALLALSACDPWNNWPGYGWEDIDDRLWDDEVVNVEDGTYVRLPQAGRLVRVNGDGSFDAVDLDGARPVRVLPTPDQQQVLVFAQWPSCDDPDEEITLVDDCDSDDRLTVE